MCKALQKAGAQIHYVYGGLESFTEEQELEMRAAWDHVYILPRLRASERRQSFKTHHGIDDWYAETLDEVVQKILKTWRIHYCIANYVWFSRWLSHVPAGIPKLVDTHDIFADRHARLRSDGIAASWYSTTPEEESIGLNRADTIIAIQDTEAEELKSRTQANVVTLGHFIEPDFSPVQDLQPHDKCVVGYMASDNPINQQSMKALAESLAKRPELSERFEFVLAGAICSSPAAQSGQFKQLGFVKNLADFYKGVGIVLNPNIGGTGLKIKSIEAMAHGKALIATSDAMIGIESDAAYHKLATAEDIVDFLDNEFTFDQVQAIADQSRAVIKHYMHTQQNALQAIFPDLPGHSKSDCV